MTLIKVDHYYHDDNYVFFWSGCFSNWFKCKFNMEIDDELYRFNCSEQAMMLYKALTFKDNDAMLKIMQASSPKEQKNIGRAVKNYDESTWSAVREDIMYNILVDKFSQNHSLYKILKSTDTKIIVESSPVDFIWGIGMHVVQYPNICDQTQWRGQNLLGKCLMKVRDII